MRFEVLDAAPARLGECPIWCGRSNRLWWVDVLASALWSHDAKSGVCTRYPVEARRIGSLALRRTSGLILACDNGLFSYDPETGEQLLLVDPQPGLLNHRKHDGRADSVGNFWIGTLREDDYAPVGSIYRVTPKLEVTRQAARLAIPSSLAFDPERRRIYYADTRAHTIWFSDYDPISGDMGEELPFCDHRCACPTGRELYRLRRPSVERRICWPPPRALRSQGRGIAPH